MDVLSVFVLFRNTDILKNLKQINVNYYQNNILYNII